MAYPSSVGCDLGGDQPTGYAILSACFHTPEITITLASQIDTEIFASNPQRGAELAETTSVFVVHHFNLEDYICRVIYAWPTSPNLRDVI
jgi:hypothetical protein